MTQPHSNQCSHKREFTGSYKWIIGCRVQGSQTQEIKHYHQKSVCIFPLCFPVLASFSDSLFLHGRFLQVMSTLALVQSKKKKFLLPCAYSKYPRICLLWLDLVELWKSIHPQIHSHIRTGQSCLWPGFYLSLCVCIPLCLTEPSQTLLKYPFLVLL